MINEHYRVKKIRVRRGWAIDQISFQYSDDTVWSVGVDGGIKDNREIILTEGEYIVRVTHETLYQKWYAGASLQLETNKRRIFTFHPYLATEQKEVVTTLCASPGKEIIKLVIRNGVLEGITEQDVPQEEIKEHVEWFCTVDNNGVRHFGNLSDAQQQLKNSLSGVMIDVVKNKVIIEKGGHDQARTFLKQAIEAGVYLDSVEEKRGIEEIFKFFTKSLKDFSDPLLWFLCILLTFVGNFMSGHATILSGHSLALLSSENNTQLRNFSYIEDVCNLTGCCERTRDSKVVIILLLLVAKILANGIQSVSRQLREILRRKRACLLKERLFKHTLNLDMSYFDSSALGDITSALSPDGYLAVTLDVVLKLLESTAQLVCNLYLMIRISYQLTLSLLLIFLVLKLVLMEFFIRKALIISKLSHKIATFMGQTEHESVSMIQSVKMLSKEQNHLDDQVSALAKTRELLMLQSFYDLCVEFLAGSLDHFAFCTGMLFCIFSLNFMNQGDLTAFFFLFQGCLGLYQSVLSTYEAGVKQLPLAEKVFHLLNRESKLKSGPLEPETFNGKIEFKDVTFTYPTRPGTPVISNLTFTAHPGQITAVVGDSGAGKTTLTSLLLRLYDPDEGGIFVDGYNLKELDLKHYHRHVSVVNQNPLLFNGSIRDNIAYGAVREVGMEEIEWAARQANAHKFITSFRAEYDTQCWTKGTQLSGGQCQRIAIARAAIRDPKILILDEATSSLDAENEKIVCEALERIMKGKTIFVIAHRLSTIRRADRIIVLQNGRVVEHGNHRSLVAANGVYKKLFSKQLVMAEE